MLMDEWVPVKGIESYEVSRAGDVRRAITTKASRTAKPGRLKTLRIDRVGYMSVTLSHQGGAFYRRVHRLVATAFIGPAPFPRAEVNHKNGNKLDNRVENLEWCSGAENHEHASRMGLIPFGERHWKAKLTTSDILDIREMRKAGALIKEIAAIKKVSSTQIANVISGHSWAHVPHTSFSLVSAPQGKPRTGMEVSEARVNL